MEDHQVPMNGVLIVDKPKGITSHDVVHRVRRILGQKAVGHLGTLDPAATGVLPIVLGNLTRLAQFYLHSEKSYEGEICFGFATDTYDADGEVVGSAVDPDLNIDRIRELAAEFVGKIEQMPPPFSAKKVGGVPAYKLARKKQEVALTAVEVEVKEFEILSCAGTRATFRMKVSSGTYVRSIAHELGQRLGCGAHLSSLRRTSLAEFTIEDAYSLDALASSMQQGSAVDCLTHPRKLLPQFPSVAATDEVVAMIRHGRGVNLPDVSRSKYVKVFRGQTELIAVATRIAGTLFHAGIVFAAEEAVVCRG